MTEKPLPPHGTTSRYLTHGCRCDQCRDAAVAAEKRRDYLRARGHKLTVDNATARAWARALLDAGWSQCEIARAAGVSQGRVSYLIRNEGRCRASFADRILSVPYSRPVDAALAPAHGTRLRLRALSAIGWDPGRIAAQTGGRVTTTAIYDVMLGHHERVLRSTATGVRNAYAALWDKEPPRGKGRTWALKRAAQGGWLPPVALDDELLDDPDYVPDVTHVRAVDGPAETLLERLEDLLNIDHVTGDEAATRLGVTWGSIHRACTRHNRRDLLEVMQATTARRDYGRWTA